ncbi:MAG: DUF262 domain-containing protein [Sandaracinaceae bacterium]|nr:DUF262 domain-containing protein [Sandaracinaceae bacterium]
MQIYDQDSKPLADLLAEASSEQGATLLVPDLQRPYVWSPNQVTLLVDSLLRGWPFGTLLLWEMRSDHVASIPSRPFWRVVDRTRGDVNDEQVSRSHPPATFRMVLDGQQRLQSLLLAFGGDSWGFRLLDREWAAALESERPRGRNSWKHWSLGHLCLDLVAFRGAIQREPELSRMDFSQVLTWVVTNPSLGRSALWRPANYGYPIPAAHEPAENVGRFARLSRLWAIARNQSSNLPRHYAAPVQQLLEEHSVAADAVTDLVGPLSELVLTLAGVQREKVGYLWLKAYDQQVSQDVYNDAIVNIFTRLNTAGRALTRQEITFAWIKIGWDASRVDNRTAGKCFDDLASELDDSGVQIDTDALVGSVSLMWSVLFQNGELLTSNDLLRGDKVRPMAQELVAQWTLLSGNAVEAARRVADRSLVFGTHYRSLNVLNLLTCWRLLGRRWLSTHSLGVAAADAFEKRLEAAFDGFCDRWIVLSQWSGKWGRGTSQALAEYARDLAEDWAVIQTEPDADAVIRRLEARMTAWLSALAPDAAKYVEELVVTDRGQVHQYYLALWLWHRLGTARWDASKVSLRDSKRGRLRLDVDHVVSVSHWMTLAAALPVEVADDSDGLTQEDVRVAMNVLGNCCLLEKSFNISKGAKSLESFLESVHEFQSGTLVADAWAADLAIPSILLTPGDDVSNLVGAAAARTQHMKAELREFVVGARGRADV